jgi:hypothetical protein
MTRKSAPSGAVRYDFESWGAPTHGSVCQWADHSPDLRILYCWDNYPSDGGFAVFEGGVANKTRFMDSDELVAFCEQHGWDPWLREAGWPLEPRPPRPAGDVFGNHSEIWRVRADGTLTVETVEPDGTLTVSTVDVQAMPADVADVRRSERVHQG